MEVFAGHGFISQAVQEVGAGQSFCGLAFPGSLLNGFDSCESYLTSNLLGYPNSASHEVSIAGVMPVTTSTQLWDCAFYAMHWLVRSQDPLSCWSPPAPHGLRVYILACLYGMLFVIFRHLLFSVLLLAVFQMHLRFGCHVVLRSVPRSWLSILEEVCDALGLNRK